MTRAGISTLVNTPKPALGILDSFTSKPGGKVCNALSGSNSADTLNAVTTFTNIN